ncbi:MAG: ABC transporter permease [Thermoleophilia bacterium]|nr:ABC transporter permease [Thermoleophilia bacterium]
MGVFIALAALVVYYVILNRTTLGYEVRAVGFNPEAARYGGISVGRSYFLALAIAGAFAGLAGSLDILGWKFTVATNDIQVSTVGFVGIAVALLGRNKAVGIFFAALLFAALQTGTSSRQLDPDVFPPELASNLSTMIQALIILFVATELLILYIWQARKRLGFSGPARVQAQLKG